MHMQFSPPNHEVLTQQTYTMLHVCNIHVISFQLKPTGSFFPQMSLTDMEDSISMSNRSKFSGRVNDAYVMDDDEIEEPDDSDTSSHSSSTEDEVFFESDQDAATEEAHPVQNGDVPGMQRKKSMKE